MAKMKPIELTTDDFVLNGYRLHEGETVTLFPATTAGDNRLTRDLIVAETKLKAIQGDPDEREQTIAWVDEVNTAICAKLAQRVVAWTWTDDAEQPLPQPDGTPEPFLALRQEEVMYLWNKSLSGESAADEKKDSRPSPITSSASGPQPTRTRSSTARNHTRR
jgi:hypothetical protein